MSTGCELSLRERESESELCGLIEHLHAGAAHAPGADHAGGAVHPADTAAANHGAVHPAGTAAANHGAVHPAGTAAAH